MVKALLILLLILLVVPLLYAHEGHKSKNIEVTPDTLTIVDGDTIAINGIPIKKFLINHSEEFDEPREKTDENNKKELKEIKLSAAFEHVHNKVIHFPIAITVVGGFLMVLGYKDNKYWKVLKIIIPAAALFSTIAVFTGLAQTESFKDSGIYNLVDAHSFLGYSAAVSLLFWSISLQFEKYRSFAWIFMVLSIVMVLLTGFYGGVIAH